MENQVPQNSPNLPEQNKSTTPPINPGVASILQNQVPQKPADKRTPEQIEADKKIEIEKNSGAWKKNSESGSKTLRTYEDDVRSAVQSQSISTSRVLMAEQRRRYKEEKEIEITSVSSKTNVTKIFMSILLVLAGISAVGGAYYLITKYKSENIQPPVSLIQPGEFTDKDDIVYISTSNKLSRDVISEIRKAIREVSTLKDNSVREIILQKEVRVDLGDRIEDQTQKISSEEFFRIIESRAPEELPRSLEDNFMIGVHRHNDANSPFIIFRTTDFEQSFARMLEWEPLIVREVRDIFFYTLGSSQFFVGDNIEVEQKQTSSSDTNIDSATTSTSTEPQESKTTSSESESYDPRGFKDLVLENRDTRVIKDKNGKILFFYSFVDRKNLVLTTNMETLSEIIKRLNTNKLLR